MIPRLPVFPVPVDLCTGGFPDVWASSQVGDFGLGMEYEERIVMIGCYRCSGFNIDTAPLRCVVAEFTTPGSDPTQAYRLSCGHSVI